MDISVIIPIYNGEKWIDRCFESIASQTALKTDLRLELSIFNDASVDCTEELLERWRTKFADLGIAYITDKNDTNQPKGVGFAKNAAVKNSNGQFLCFQDVDDKMLPDRVLKQYKAAKLHLNAIIGSRFYREPENSTERYTNWANNLNENELNIQIYTSHGPTVIMPTWFMDRRIFNKIGGFSEVIRVPEDLIFFYRHIDEGGRIFRVDDSLLVYTYHPEATTFQITSEQIWELRLKQLRKHFLPQCGGFTIWNCGKQGRKFFKSLTEEERSRVMAMCDVDVNKIGTHYEMFDPASRTVVHKIPIVHFSAAKPPIVICVKMDMTNGAFESNLKSLNLTEGTDYVLFS